MWQCRFCQKSFNFTRTTEKGNHSKHCDMNPSRADSYKKLKESSEKRFNKKLGEYKDFSVVCSTCNESFIVNERERLFPTKTQYFCSRNCSNSVGGKAKVEKYGYSQYRTIAEKYYKQQCVACGVTDILDVHHIDEDRGNLHPSNLIFLCPNDHYRYHRNKDKRIEEVIQGHGTAWGGHFVCTEEFSRVQTPDAPPDYFLK